MGNRVFILFFVISTLSFLFVSSVSLFLKVRSTKDIRYSGIFFTAFFAVLIIPFFDVFSLFDISVFVNYTGGVRAELQNAVTGKIILRDLYFSKSLIEGAGIFCGILVYLRLITSAGYFTYMFSGYLNNLHFLTKHSEECHDDKIKLIYERARKKSGLKRNPPLRVMRKDIRLSPCTCGIIFPSVYVGKEILYDYTDERLELVFLHELTHIRNGDSMLKLLSLLAASLFSFLPGAKNLSRAVNEDVEYRCDNEVIKRTGASAVGEYMTVIIDIAERNIRSDYTGYDFLSPASRSGELIIERYKKLKKGTDKRKNNLYAFGVLSAALCMNVIFMSSFSAVNSEDPGVDFADPLLEKAVCAYFDVSDPDKITKSIVDSIYSIEFMMSDYSLMIEEAGIGRNEYAAVKINEGLLFNSEKVILPSSDDGDIPFSCDLIERVIRKERYAGMLASSEEWCSLLGDAYIAYENCMILPDHDINTILTYLTHTVGKGQFAEHHVSRHTVDTRDITLFGELRTLIFSDYLKASDENIYISEKYAVIRRGE